MSTFLNRKKRNPIKEFKYEDNLGDKKLNISLITDRLLEWVGEDLVNQLNNLSSINESGEVVSMVGREMKRNSE